jgi:aspartyl protease family protein
MRQVLILAATVLAGGGYAAHLADRSLIRAEVPAETAKAEQPAPQPVSFGRSLVLDSDTRGHFTAEARVDGRRIDFMVDTGASLVALRESDAALVGIRPMPADYTAAVSTANGTVKAARAKLDRVEIGEITVFDVAALVLPDEVLSRNLLGVSFLSKLKRYEYAGGRLVLEQ